MKQISRRNFLKQSALLLGTLSSLPERLFAQTLSSLAAGSAGSDGPRTILIRFGGGVRRRETIDPDHTFSPFFCHELTRQGVLYPNMEISREKGINTSHGEGTLNLLTGKFDKYKDVDGNFLGGRFEAKVPTLFEYLRRSLLIPEHQALLINGEDRTDEEFYSFSNHPEYGLKYRGNVLSLHRFKLYLLERQLSRWKGSEKERQEKQQQLSKLQVLDYRVDPKARTQSPPVQALWEKWREYYGESGLVNPRGDRLLTELTLWALRELKPRFVMVNYQDPDYVHWGNAFHYTRAISIIDEGLRRITEALESDVHYRGRTLLVVAPDCGRDSNPLLAVPYQHHFGDKTAHEVFALFIGPGLPKGKRVERVVLQSAVAPTIGKWMGVSTPYAEGPILPEVFA